MTRIFITGGTGYLAGELRRQALSAGHILCATYFSQAPEPDSGVLWVPLDVRDPLAVEEAIDTFRPEVVFHTAFRQTGPDLYAITATGSGYVAHAAARTGARLIHMSSDVIFDGERSDAYTEEDPPGPISDYGAAKAAAEALVAEAAPAATIVRTSLIYGFDPIDRQTRFALEIAAGQRADRLFSDEYRCPIYVVDLAAALIELLTIDYHGLINIAGAERVSRYELGRLMAAACGYDPELITAGLSAELPVRRPRNCTLDISLAQRILRTRLRGVREVLHDLGRLTSDGQT